MPTAPTSTPISGALTPGQFAGQTPVATSTPATSITTKPTATPTSTTTPVGSTPTAPAGMTPAQTAAWNAAVALIPKTPAQNTNQSTQNTNQNTQNTSTTGNTQTTSNQTGNQTGNTSTTTQPPATYDLQTGEGLYTQPADSTKINTTLQPPAGYMVKYDSNDNAIIAPITASDQQTQLQTTMANEAQTFNTAVSNIENGTTPLNAGEQAQVDALKSQYADLINKQTLANTSANGAAMTSAARGGAEEYSSSSGGNIASIVNAGVQKLAELQSEEASAVSKLTESLQNNDINEMKTAYDALNASQEEQSKVLQDTITNTQTAIKNAQDEADTQAQLAETAKRDAADIAHQNNADYLSAQGTWTIHDNPDGSQSLVNDKTGAVQNLSSDNIITGTGSSTLMTTDPSTGDITLNSGNPLLDNNFQNTSSGIPYIDISSLTGKDLTNATESAAKLGIPVIDKTNAPLVQNIETAKTNIQNIQDDLSTLDSSNWVTAIFNKGAYALQNLSGSNPTLDAYNSDKTAYMQAIKGLLGLKTIPRGVTNTLMESFPNPGDTKEDVTAKLAKITQGLASAERGIFGGTVTDKYNPSNPTNVLNTYVNGGSSSSGNSTSSLDSLFNANTQ